jgi:hypothetical protein
MISMWVVAVRDATADLVLAGGERCDSFGTAAANIAPGAMLAGSGLLHAGDASTPWGVDGFVHGLSSESPLVLSGFIKGTGTFDNVVFNGNFAPGHSPALVTLGSTVYTASNVLEMEIGGVAAGSQHDKIVHTGIAVLGGTLNVVLLNAFAPQSGNSFDLFDWNAGLSGTFSTLNLPTLAAGLAWNVSDLYVGGQLSVAAVPEVSGFVLSGACLGLLAAGLALRHAWPLYKRTRQACATD